MQKYLATHHTSLNALLPFVITLAVILLLAGLMKFFRIQINITPSMPIGLYRQLSTTRIHRGDNVAACLPIAIAKVGLERGYLTKGSCPGGTIAILKKVIAIPGDTVQLTSKAIIVNNKPYSAPQHSRDQSGGAVTKWALNGTYKKVNGYWLYGSLSPNRSWDSRYYHEVTRPMIRNIYSPVLTF